MSSRTRSKPQWRRVDMIAGPANVLDGQIRVVKRPNRRWYVVDHADGLLLNYPGAVRGHRTMAEAKQAAWSILANRGSRR